uniref:Uncharacterized protein n=1 Tax=Accipiter nisus TaxID=211598 RepID=A0A8B9NLJ3_9AVES
MPESTTPAPAPNKNSKNAQHKNSTKEGYCIHQYQVLKQIHHETSILTKAMGIMNTFVNDITECITGKSCYLLANRAMPKGTKAIGFTSFPDFLPHPTGWGVGASEQLRGA